MPPAEAVATPAGSRSAVVVAPGRDHLCSPDRLSPILPALAEAQTSRSSTGPVSTAPTLAAPARAPPWSSRPGPTTSAPSRSEHGPLRFHVRVADCPAPSDRATLEYS